MEGFIIAVAAVVALLAALGAVIGNGRWPTLPKSQVLNRVIASLAVITLILMMAGCALAFRGGCPQDDRVCDGPMMAYVGVSFFGAIVLGMIIIIGIPVAYVTIRLLRSR